MFITNRETGKQFEITTLYILVFVCPVDRSASNLDHINVFTLAHKKLSFQSKLGSQACYRASPNHIGLSPSFNVKICTKHKTKNLVFSTSNFSYWPFTIFQNDSFFLNFLISPENRNWEPLTIQYDVEYPVSRLYNKVGYSRCAPMYGVTTDNVVTKIDR